MIIFGKTRLNVVKIKFHLFYFLMWVLDFFRFHLFIFRKMGREGGREGEKR